MPGIGIPDRPWFLVVEAPADGSVNRGGKDRYPIEKGEMVRLYTGQSLRFGNLTLKYAGMSPEDRPLIKLTDK